MLSTPESSHAAAVVLGDYGFDRPLTIMERARMGSDIESALTRYADEHAGLDELAPENRASAKFGECAAALADEPTVFSSDGDIRTDEYVAARFHELVGKANALIDRGAHPRRPVRAEGHLRVRQGVPRPLGHRVMDVMRAQRRFAGDAVIPLGT
jgi:hypothetical protein